jgi:flagellar FliJ protein
MKRFRFDLEKILEIRAYSEKQAEIELGRAIGVLTALERQLRDAAAARSGAARGNSAAEIQSHDRYMLRLDALRDRLLAEAADAELKVEAARQRFLEAARERKVFDKLKEKRRQEHRAAALAEEIKTLDDIRRGSAPHPAGGTCSPGPPVK